MDRIYLDHAATALLRPAALEAAVRALRECGGNPSSVHAAGVEARVLVESARRQVAALASADPEGIVFTSGATESNNTALWQAWHAAREGRGDHVVVSAIEHPSVLEPVAWLREAGLRVTLVGVGGDGRVDPEQLRARLDEETLLVSIQWANNETGAVQPIAELAAVARSCGALFHTDAAQAFGKIPTDLVALGVDLASFSSHKLGGPKGVGALYVRRGLAIDPFLRGGSQEHGRRAGTENVPGIAGFGAACAEALITMAESASRMERLREWLWDGIAAHIPNVVRHGCFQSSLPGTLHVSFPGASGEALVAALDLEEIAVSSGAACHSGSIEPSRVLLAMGCSRELALGALRLSVGPGTRDDEIDRVLEILPRVVARVRSAQRDYHREEQGMRTR